MSNVFVNLENSHCFPGNTVRGIVVCDFKTSKNFRQIRVILKGEESTRWTHTQRTTNSENESETRTVHYGGNHELVSMGQILLGPGQINAGRHALPFEFPLPSELPGSFKHKYGNIVYTIKATVDRAWKTNISDKKEIVILQLIKLYEIPPSFKVPVVNSDEKKIFSFGFGNNHVRMDVILQSRAFVVTEKVGFKVYIKNMSNTKVAGLRAQIKQVLNFTSERPKAQQIKKNIIAASQYAGVMAQEDKMYHLDLGVLPTTIIPNFRGSKLFSCSYELKVVAMFSGFRADMAVRTNIALIHVPTT